HAVVPEIRGARHLIEIPVATETIIAAISTLLAIAGWWIAKSRYEIPQLATDEAIERRVPGIAHTLENKYYVDEFYELIVVHPLETVSRFFWRGGDVHIGGLA